MDRHTGRAIEHARALGCTHLLLCDDDELLYAPSGRAALHAAIRSIPTGIAELHVRVLEALYPPSLLDHPTGSDVFREATVFRHRPGEYARYGWQCSSTGKSIGVLGIDGLAPAGPRTHIVHTERALPCHPVLQLSLSFLSLRAPQTTLRSTAPPDGSGRSRETAVRWRSSRPTSA